MRKNQAIKAYFLLFPALLFIIIFTIVPIGQMVYTSFFIDKLGIPKPIFNGPGNYQALIKDEIFWKVIKNNILFTCVSVPVSMVLAMLMALLLNDNKAFKKLKGLGFLRTSFFYPTVIPMIAAANIWLFLYTPDYGIFAHLAHFFGAGKNWPDNFLGSEKTVLWAMIIMNVWKEAGYLMIFYLAGLQNIPEYLYEAATIDRADFWQKFRYITLPMLSSTSLFVFIIALTNSFKMVDHLEIMTQGGPNNASNLLLYYIYQVAFSFWDNGKAATLTVVMLLIMGIITGVRFLQRDRKIYYN